MSAPYENPGAPHEGRGEVQPVPDSAPTPSASPEGQPVDAGGPPAQGGRLTDLPAAPVTGNAQVDRAVAEVADVSDLPLAEQHERLVAAHESLHRALDAEGEDDRDRA